MGIEKLYTKDEIIEINDRLFQIFLEIRRDYFEEVELHKSSSLSNPNEYQVWFIGDKIVGSEYEKEAWKQIPILSSKIDKFNDTHPIYPDGYFLDFRLNFRGSLSSGDWLMEEDVYREQVRLAFRRASKDFLTEKI